MASISEISKRLHGLISRLEEQCINKWNRDHANSSVLFSSIKNYLPTFQKFLRLQPPTTTTAQKEEGIVSVKDSEFSPFGVLRMMEGENRVLTKSKTVMANKIENYFESWAQYL